MVLVDQIGLEVRSSVGRPSHGKSQPGHGLLKSRVRIPRGHRLFSVLDVPYSDFLEGIVARNFSPVVLCLGLQLPIDNQVLDIAVL